MYWELSRLTSLCTPSLWTSYNWGFKKEPWIRMKLQCSPAGISNLLSLTSEVNLPLGNGLCEKTFACVIWTASGPDCVTAVRVPAGHLTSAVRMVAESCWPLGHSAGSLESHCSVRLMSRSMINWTAVWPLHQILIVYRCFSEKQNGR